MSIRHQGDILLNHPEFTAIGDATSLVNPSNGIFSSWSFGNDAEPASYGASSILEHAGDIAEESLDVLGPTEDARSVAFQIDELDGAADVAYYENESNLDTSAGTALFLTNSGGTTSSDTAIGSNILTVIGPLSSPSEHQDPGWFLDNAKEASALATFASDLFASWDASAPWFAASPAQLSSGLENAWSGASSAHGADITFIDTEFAAKGGTPGAPGGGGSGGGGGGGSSDPGILTEYFAGSADGNAGYDIWIEFKGDGWTTGLQDAFTQAADYFTMVITDDIGGGGRFRGKTIDDLYVTAELTSIDGTGGILGQAGPTAVWTATELTAAGQMQFDVADAQYYFDQGLWNDIVTHELMHVLGFGSLWNYGANPLVSGNEYTGAFGLEAYQNVFDPTATFIPVEDGGGSGTAGSHWDEQALTNELMTGYINNDNYLSQFSVVSLADLGYQVQYQPDGLLVA